MDMPPRESLRILVLEDDPDDAELIRHALADTALEASVRWAQTLPKFAEELAGFSPHLILSNYTLIGFDALAALALVKERAPETPFIVVSGTIGEEMAVETLKHGATDCVMKNNLSRLEIVLTRALKERRERADRLDAEAALLESRALLQQSQKMEALGRLSGGVAHDFNNLLTAITGYSELVLASPQLEEGLRADVQEILNAAFRAASLTRQLLAFSRRQIFAPKILDLNQSLRELDRMLQRIIGENIKLTLATQPDLRHVKVDADQIAQVILNLVVNARDAMPEGGELVLSTANVELGEAAVRTQPGLRPGPFAMLSVKDTGEGMDDATLAHIFEPFFTTKCKGTGLGLATVYGIVKQSNGHLEVRSRPGGGSDFRLYLPAVGGEISAAREAPVPRPPRGSETILVVDDDPSVGHVARRILERQGYTVIEARGGEEALRRCGEPGRPLDLVLTDVVMAGMSGPELAGRLKRAHPACKFLFASGYAESGTDALPDLQGRFISKPFTVDELIAKVRQALDLPPT